MARRLLGVLAAAVVLASCSRPPDAATHPGAAPSPPSSPPSSSAPSSPAPRPVPLDPALVADLQAVLRAHPDSEISVALTPVGAGERPRVVGDDPTLVAWSTIKVPLTLAVIRSDITGRDAAIEVALTASDNAAAQRLWEALGSGDRAAAAVETQLRRGGDEHTQVPAEVTAPAFSAFGQSQWSLRDQDRFTAELPCLAGSDPVTGAMGRVISAQQWGLGRIEGARLKGGWGPTPQGYVVRQLGLVPGAKGATAAAMQVRTSDHARGTAIMDELAAVLDQHAGDLPAGTCE